MWNVWTRTEAPYIWNSRMVLARRALCHANRVNTAVNREGVIRWLPMLMAKRIVLDLIPPQFKQEVRMMIEQTPKAPTLDDLRRMYQEGLPQTLISGIEVRMRPVTPDRLLQLGRIPDTLAPIMLKGLYEDIHKDLDKFVEVDAANQEATLEMIRAVDAVCEAALLEPDIVPYLSLADRMWIFKLAFMPAEVLSTFRFQPTRNVEAAADGEGPGDKTKPASVRAGRAGRVPA
jgi:hypothetical protein